MIQELSLHFVTLTMIQIKFGMYTFILICFDDMVVELSFKKKKDMVVERVDRFFYPH